MAICHSSFLFAGMESVNYRLLVLNENADQIKRNGCGISTEQGCSYNEPGFQRRTPGSLLFIYYYQTLSCNN
jgi:hypothetical protein